MTSTLRAALTALALPVALAACNLPYGTSEGAPAGLRFEHGTSFGMCLGYCTTVLRVDADSTVLTLEATGRGGRDLPTRRFARATDAGRWAELTEAADRDALEALPETIGCPDCADGGAEWVAMAGTGEAERVTFEYGADVETIERLQAVLRAERATFDDQVEAARAEAAPGD